MTFTFILKSKNHSAYNLCNYDVTGSILDSTLKVSFLFHFKHEETETQNGLVTCPRSHSNKPILEDTSTYEGFPGGSEVKNLPAVQKPQEMWVQSLGQEVPLEKSMAIHSSILAWRILWSEEPGGLWSMGLQRAGQD